MLAACVKVHYLIATPEDGYTPLLVGLWSAPCVGVLKYWTDDVEEALGLFSFDCPDSLLLLIELDYERV
ncbi:hypothetical protein F0P96_04455 [Hymenobacter busanensis]|uniref:Uncharacterized protein n=1 Tax=Hymenobacter busanensis TaxID=2607656 RepID=A0A7L4ZTB7_9BACT|nr:hypothetical protein [Hymenobacter busanensis]KAA9339874.1 hypothetical protein F0P96_04455 [Hymenobacter busanensis]QHJ06371.1 hypothetical protein GUY19_03280 [Hymenobacter busanensis]